MSHRLLLRTAVLASPGPVPRRARATCMVAGPFGDCWLCPQVAEPWGAACALPSASPQAFSCHMLTPGCVTTSQWLCLGSPWATLPSRAFLPSACCGFLINTPSHLSRLLIGLCDLSLFDYSLRNLHNSLQDVLVADAYRVTNSLQNHSQNQVLTWMKFSFPSSPLAGPASAQPSAQPCVLKVFFHVLREVV